MTCERSEVRVLYRPQKMESAAEEELEKFRTEIGSIIQGHKERMEQGRLDYNPNLVFINPSDLTQEDKDVAGRSEEITQEEFRNYQGEIPPDNSSRINFAAYYANKISARIMREG